MPAIHPLKRELLRTPLQNPSAAQMDAVFDAAAKGGVTPVEAALLGQVLEQYGAGWSAAKRNAWTNRLGALEPGAAIVRPTVPDSAQAEDLSGDVRVLWAQEYNSETQRVFVADLLALAKKYDFEMVLQVPPWRNVGSVATDLLQRTRMTPGELDRRLDVVKPDLGWEFSDWAEDNKILTNADDMARKVRVLLPPTVSEDSLLLAQLFTAAEGYHPYEPDSFQGAVTARGENVAALKMAQKETGRPYSEMRTYVEGGNLLPGTSADGKAYGLIGRDSLIVSLFHLDEQGAFSPQAVRTARQALQASNAEVLDTARKLADVRWQLGYGGSGQLTQADLEEAKDFLAKLALTQQLMAKELGISAEQLVSVTQPEFHIDMAMRPLGPGEVLVHHPAAAIQLIDEALQDPQATSWQLTELRQMRAHAVEDLQVRGHVYDQILSELDDAGLIAVPVGGVFWSNRRGANFMNAVPGTTKDGLSFYFTTGSSITPLERAFQRRLEGLGVEAVEFIAKAGGGRWSLSAGEQSIFDFGALDCREVHHRGRSGVTNDLLGQVLGTHDDPALWS